MTVCQPRFSTEEFVRCGDKIYQIRICPQVEEGNFGKIVAINILTVSNDMG